MGWGQRTLPELRVLFFLDGFVTETFLCKEEIYVKYVMSKCVKSLYTFVVWKEEKEKMLEGGTDFVTTGYLCITFSVSTKF